MKKNFVHQSFWCCSFHETKAEKKKKERKRQKQGSKRKQKRKTGRKEKRTRRRERQRKKNWKRGRPKKAKEEQRETLKNKQKCPFLGGKQGFFVLQSKERKGTKTNQKKQKINKFGGFRAKWGGPLGHLTWPLNPPKHKKNKNKNKKKKQKKTRRV